MGIDSKKGRRLRKNKTIGVQKLSNVWFIVKKIVAILSLFIFPLMVSLIIEFIVSGGSEITTSYFVQLLSLIGALLAWYVLKKDGLADIKFTSQPMVFYVCFFCLGFTFNQIVIYILNLLYTVNITNSFEYNFMSVISAILFAAVSEEIVFRGLIMGVINHGNLYKKAHGKRECVVICLIVSIIWTALHMRGIAVETIFLLIDGLILGLIYYRFKNLFLCMLYHSGLNTSTLMLGWLDKAYWNCGLVTSLIVFVISIAFIRYGIEKKRCNSMMNENDYKEKNGKISIIMLSGLFFFLMAMMGLVKAVSTDVLLKILAICWLVVCIMLIAAFIKYRIDAKK